MIYAMQTGNATTVVAAADEVVELEIFHTTVIDAEDILFVKEWVPDVTDMLMDDRFDKFRIPPYVFEHDSEEQRDAFARLHAIKIVPDFILVDKHGIMLARIEPDRYVEGHDDRTIGEILGLTEYDPWDTRTDEQKAQDAEHAKKAAAAKKAGTLTGDSFSPGAVDTKKKTKSDVYLTDVRMTRNNDGSVTIDDVIAVKGLWDKDEPAVPADVTVADAQPEERFFMFGIDSWLDILVPALMALDILEPEFTNEDYYGTVVAINQVAGSPGWFALRGERNANRVAGLFDHHGVDYTVNVVDARMARVADFVRNDGLAQEIEPGGMIAIYHRLDVAGGDLESALAVLDRALAADGKTVANYVAARGQFLSFCWLAFVTKLAAEKIEGLLKADPAFANVETEVYGVNDRGERLVPKGIQIVEDEVEPTLPRPWNERAGEIAGMDEAALKANTKSLKGKEFIFCGSYRGAQDGCVFYITPRSYFSESGEMWEQELDLSRFRLPSDIRQEQPGVFRTRSRDWLTLNHILVSVGMIESLGLQLYINCL